MWSDLIDFLIETFLIYFCPKTGNHEITELQISGCSGSVCDVQEGSTVTITATFVANQNTSTATIEITAIVDGMDISLDNGMNPFLNRLKLSKITQPNSLYYNFYEIPQ